MKYIGDFYKDRNNEIDLTNNVDILNFFKANSEYNNLLFISLPNNIPFNDTPISFNILDNNTMEFDATLNIPYDGTPITSTMVKLLITITVLKGDYGECSFIAKGELLNNSKIVGDIVTPSTFYYNDEYVENITISTIPDVINGYKIFAY